MLAEQLLCEGDLAGARTALQERVRQDPSSAAKRVFLFQLLCVLGDWPRALTQLNVAAELDAAMLPMAQTYRAAIQCEALRTDIFKGTRAPLIFGPPMPWLAQLVQALQHDGVDDGLAAAMRAQAFEAAPAASGSIDGVPFAWLADADPRLGPVLEAIVNGRYFWIPMAHIHQIAIEAPADLRDAVWMPASFTWTNGADTVGLIPTRYVDTAARHDAALLLARRTEWTASAGLGQRMLVSDTDDYALMAVRRIGFDHAPTDAGDAVLDTGVAGTHHG
jgi:type VI secretion system protein ImpE